jgi:hypothetical protein
VVTLGDVIDYVRILDINFQSKKSKVNVDLYKNDKQILQSLVHKKAEQKIAYYDRKITQMKQKYSMDFLTFENSIYLREGKVDFEELDDFIMWGGYVKAYRYWEQYILP